MQIVWKRGYYIYLLLFLLVFMLSYILLKAREKDALGGDLEPVVVASRNMREGTWITPALVEVQRVPKRFVQPGAFRSSEDVLGMVSASLLRKGEQVLDTKVMYADEGGGISSMVSDGKRGIGVELEGHEMAGGLIRPGDHVDVFVTFGTSRDGEKKTVLLLQDVAILAVGGRTRSAGLESRDRKGESPFGASFGIGHKFDAEGRNSVTLLVDALDATRLVHAKHSGEITLSVRSPSDRSVLMDNTAQGAAEAEAFVNTALPAGKKGKIE